MSCMQKFLYFNYKVTRILGTAWGKSTILILNLVQFFTSLDLGKVVLNKGTYKYLMFYK